jgi:hypothetical protein
MDPKQFGDFVYTDQIYGFDLLKKSICVDDEGHCVISRRFYRNLDDEIIYAEHKKKTRKKYGSMAKFINDDIFGKHSKDIVITDNAFPYNLDKECRQMLIWSKRTMTPEEINKTIRDTGTTEYIWFENMDEFKSIPEIVHYHIIIRTKIEK